MSIRGTAVSRVSTSGAQGEADIVAQFRARHLELVRLAALLLGDSAAAEDVVQDVFTRVWEGRYRLVLRALGDPDGRALITGPFSRNPAIVTFLSQFTFANDTPGGGEFRGGTALSSPAGWMS